ncbi:hypothetical protein CCP2SC5_2230002 [Azospirillaceae bacterium]
MFRTQMRQKKKMLECAIHALTCACICEYDALMTNIDLTLRRIRAFAESNGWKKSRLAREAGLCDTVLRHFDKDRWNPTAQTLRTLEAIIPPDFSFDEMSMRNGRMKS